MPGVKITFLEIEPILMGLKGRAQRLLVSHPRVREVSLFGSLVRGNYGPGSDADLLVLLESVVLGYLNPHYFAGGDLRSVYSAPLSRPQLTVRAPSHSLDTARQGTRPAYFDEYQEYRDTPIYQRDLLPPGAQFDGPAIVEQPDTTTVVYPGLSCRVDDAGNLLLTLMSR